MIEKPGDYEAQRLLDDHLRTPDNTMSEQEIARRRDEAIRRALKTPPKPHS